MEAKDRLRWDDQTRRVVILIVEDSPADAMLMQMILNEIGFPLDIHLVEDGDEAIQFLYKEGKYGLAPRPDALFLDIHLPKRSGLDVLQQMKCCPDLSSIPVYILTTSSSAADKARSLELKATRFITKPEDLLGFQNILKHLVSEDFPRLRL